MAPPQLSIVIPTRNRQQLVRRAIESALAQSLSDLEVIVVDDGSDPPLVLDQGKRLRLVPLPARSGPGAARNAGLAVARGKWITFLDDDDRLLPHMAEASLEAIHGAALPPPVAAISGIEVVGPGGRVIERRIPPSHPRGEHFFLEPLDAGRSHLTKQTLFLEPGLLRELGGFDGRLPFHEHSDLFLRLNPVCSIVGVPTVGYRLSRTSGPRFSREGDRLNRGFRQLVEKHRTIFEEHPRGYADALLGQIRISLLTGPRRIVPLDLLRALRIAPGHSLSVLLNPRRMARAARGLRYSG
jgi:glycosyltransferase involved in cell wall biosynthesis